MQGRIAGHKARQPLRPVRNIRLVLAFDGAAFHGWQLQPGKPTIQQAVMDAIERVSGERVVLTGSGRTDAGTHARGLVANFTTNARMPAEAWVPALNCLLHRDIRVLSSRRVPLAFHARLAAQSKIYCYQIYRGPVIPPHLAREHFHYPYALDVRLMERAAQSFVGEHDFAGFAAKSGLRPEKQCAGSRSTAEGGLSERHHEQTSGPPGRREDVKVSTVRRILSCGLKSRGLRLIFTVEGNGFLHHMVRNMAGTLLDLGRGKMTFEQFEQLFEKRDRTLAGFTAPAHGLILLRVRY